MVVAMIIFGVFFGLMVLAVWSVMPSLDALDDDAQPKHAAATDAAAMSLLASPATRTPDGRCVLCRAPVRAQTPTSEHVIAELERQIAAETLVVARTLRDPRPEAFQYLYMQ